MGRVHKKKLAEYAEAAENDDRSKSVAETEEEEEGGKSASAGEELRYSGDSDAEDADAVTDSKNDSKDEQAAEETHDANDDETVNSGDGENYAETSDKNGAGKKGNKRKANQNAAKKLSEDLDEGNNSDDDPQNGGGGSAAKKGRKTAAKGKAKAAKVVPKGKGKTAAAKKPVVVEEEDEVEEDEEEGEEEEEYEVQEIIKHKVDKGGQTLYLIRWKGYTKDDDTWEPEETLSCPDIIKKYKEKTGTTNSKSSSKKSTTPAKKGGKGGESTTAKAQKEDPNKEWEVDKIIDYAVEKAGRVFRIRWKGFSPKYDTWEPEKNLYCEDLIEKFMERMNAQDNVSFKELREEPKKTKRLVNETAPRTDIRNKIERKSKRGGSKKRVYYGGDSDE